MQPNSTTKTHKDATKQYKEDTDLRNFLEFKICPQITPILLCLKAENENTRYKSQAAMLGLHKGVW